MAELWFWALMGLIAVCVFIEAIRFWRNPNEWKRRMAEGFMENVYAYYKDAGEERILRRSKWIPPLGLFWVCCGLVGAVLLLSGLAFFVSRMPRLVMALAALLALLYALEMMVYWKARRMAERERERRGIESSWEA